MLRVRIKTLQTAASFEAMLKFAFLRTKAHFKDVTMAIDCCLVTVVLNRQRTQVIEYF